MNRKPSRRIRVWAVIFWLLVWQLGSMALNMHIFLVSPVEVVVRLSELIRTADFWTAILSSTLRITAGFLLGSLFGVVLAALSARFRRAEELMAPLLLAVKSVPVASFIILALILFSSKNLAVLISLLIALPIQYENLLTGIRAADRQLLEMAQVFSLSAGRTIRYIYLPQVYPFFRSACSSVCGLCWKSGIAAEVIGITRNSIGGNLQQAKTYLDTADLFAWTLVIVVVSLCFEHVVLWLLNRGGRRLEKL